MREVDVVIIGAGPAGSVCGYLLKKAGKNCLLVDHASFPRDKVCGGGMSPRCWKLLHELIPGIKYEYNSVRKFRLMVEDHHRCDIETAIEFRLVKRKTFDAQLLEQYKSVGGEFIKGSFLKFKETADGVVVTLKSGEQIACKYLVGADGSTSSVRHFLTGNNDNGFIIVEQYVEKSPDNALEVGVSRHYDLNGYFYRFPNDEFDAVGYGDQSAGVKKCRQVLQQRGIPESPLRGCHIYLKNDYPLNDRIILIGDAGGFANRTTCEGIKAAFMSASHAAEAITSGRPFREVNARLFKKMKWEETFTKCFFTPSTIWLLGQLCRWPSVVKWCLDRVLRP